MADRGMNILVAGATSLIAQETLRAFAEQGKCNFLLISRSKQKLDAFAEDLKARGALSVGTLVGDLVDSSFHKTIVETAKRDLLSIDLAFLAWGMLGDEDSAQLNFQEAKKIIVVNGTSYISLLIELGNFFQNQQSGTIAVITSVAGDRGRKSNYTYGSSKALVSAFLSGFRGRMADFGVKVIDIKPGRVSTPMTAHLSHSPLMAEPSYVGKVIYKSILRGRPVVYAPWYWRWIMFAIKFIPIAIFNRIKF